MYFCRALIYGKLGGILGHEIIHGLAGTGWTTLKNGSLTPPGQCLVNQYNNFSTPALREENVTLNGLLTLRENIPDNAGLLGAYKAFKKSTFLDGRAKKADKLAGFTEDQLFFLGFAQVHSTYMSMKCSGMTPVCSLLLFKNKFVAILLQNWCETKSKASLRSGLQKEDHAPGMFRVLGTLRNSEEFATAWKCPLGSKMNPFPSDHQKCKIF